MGRNTTKNMPEGRPFGHVALIGPPLAGPAHGPGRLNRRRKLTQKGAESPGRPGRPASRARWAARPFGRGVAAGGGRPGLGSLPSPKAAGRRMARTWGRWHRKPSPGREYILAAAWSSSGGIPLRGCRPPLTSIGRRSAPLRDAAHLFRRKAGGRRPGGPPSKPANVAPGRMGGERGRWFVVVPPF